MRDRGALYAGILLIAFGGLALLAQWSGMLLGPLGIEIGWAQLWPFVIIIAGLAFWLPLAIWWDRRDRIAGLVIPGTIILANGLLFLYQNTTGDWKSWAYLWTLEPISVGLGLLLFYLVANRQQGVLVAATIVGGVGLVFFVIFASIFGGWIRLLVPVILIVVGCLLLLRGVRDRVLGGMPE